MAENSNRNQDRTILNDCQLMDTYKAGLNQLRASDELIETTLEKCRAELDNAKRRPMYSLLSKMSLKYCAPIAACLLVLVILLNYPTLISNKSNEDAAPIQESGLMTAQNAAGLAGGSESPAKAPTERSFEDGVLIQSFPESLPYGTAASPKMNEDSEMDVSDEGSNNESSILKVERLDAALNSRYSSLAFTSQSMDVPKEACDAILTAYNAKLGAQFTYEADMTVAVSTLKEGGISADMLRSASGFEDLLGEQIYSILPLKDENHKFTVLLPILESAEAYDDPSPAPFDISFSQEGRVWLSSQNAGIPATDSQVLYLFDRAGHEKLVRDTFSEEEVSEYILVDISNGSDYIVFMKAGGQEYAVPVLATGSYGSLENGRAYPARDVMNGLADILESNR